MLYDFPCSDTFRRYEAYLEGEPDLVYNPTPDEIRLEYHCREAERRYREMQEPATIEDTKSNFPKRIIDNMQQLRGRITYNEKKLLEHIEERRRGKVENIEDIST